MILPAVNVNGIHLSSQQHEALVSIWRTGRMPEAQTGQKPWLWIQALRRRGLVSGNALRLTDKGRHIVQLLQDRKAFRSQSTADNPHYGAYYYSSSKEMTLAMFQDSTELTAADSMMRTAYPNLDLQDAWNAFSVRHYARISTVGDWIRLWRGWCENRAQMGGIPPSKPHVHTWACEHTLKALHLQSQDDVTDMASAVKKANELNQKEEP